MVGSVFSLDDENDISEMGVELKWMTVEQMVDEATNVYPGVVAINKGYCLLESASKAPAIPTF